MTAQTVDKILAGWPSTFDTMGDAMRMQEMVEYARTLERELAAARADAERYKYARLYPMSVAAIHCHYDKYEPEFLDEGLDYAIAARKERP